MERSNNWWRRL